MKTCSVSNCKNKVRFRFPSEIKIRKAWLQAIRKPDLKIDKNTGLCENHFKKSDLKTENSFSSYKYKKNYLKSGVIPSLFVWNQENEIEASDAMISEDENVSNLAESFEIGETIEPLEGNADTDSLKISTTTKKISKAEILEPNIFDPNIDVQEEIVETIKVDENSKKVKFFFHNSQESENIKIKSQAKVQKFSIDDFQNDPAGVLEFTGLEDFEKFTTVFLSLGEKVYHLRYHSNVGFGKLTEKDQLFMTLWKLRKNATDAELSRYFGVNEKQVGNIFKTWINFMSKQWSRLNIWPDKKQVQYYMPDNFKADFPNCRVIIDGTEVNIQATSDPKIQQSTFSYYKNRTTLKTIVGNTPGGLFSFYTPMYGGSTSDRHIVERSDLRNKCEAGDLIMADRGFTVQDIFASHGVTVATPHFKGAKGHLPLKDLLKDRKLSKYRVHVERIIGSLKTYKILSTKLNHNYVSLASEITGICVMLCNFRECIM